jgi:hypothetical protein
MVVCTNDVVLQIFFTANNFTLQDVTITLQGNDNEMPVYCNMPSSYTIDDAGVNSVVIKESGIENMWHADTLGRQHEITHKMSQSLHI